MAIEQSAFATPVALRGGDRNAPCVTPLRKTAPVMSTKKGLFGKLRDAVLRPIVSVPGAQGNGELLDCVFCEASGYQSCTGCNGSGKDALGRCLMCEGAGNLKCNVCSGVGIVDRIRRGGTDDKNEYVVKAQTSQGYRK